MEYIIIKLLLTSNYFNKYFSYLDLNYYKDNNKEVYKILRSIQSLFEKETKDYSVNDLSLFFYTQYPYMKPDDKALYEALFERVEKAEYDESLVEEYLQKQAEIVHAGKIAVMAVDASQGRREFSSLVEYVRELESAPKPQEEFDFVTDNLEELYNETRAGQGFRWRLATLNKVLGSLRKGDFGFIFARPEVGKTTFLASEITYMASQSDGPILWCNNEEQGSKVNTRCYQAALGLTTEQLFLDIKGNQEKYFEITKQNIKILDDAGLSRKQVERICAQLQPKMIIFDQGDKVYGFEADRYDLKMKAIYQWMRELSKLYGPVISVCQAGGTAENKKYLTMTDVDSSHTAKQGEADFILGIGATNSEGEENIRYLHASKNKLAGDEDSIPDLRHGKVSVIIQPEIGRYKDSINWN